MSLHLLVKINFALLWRKTVNIFMLALTGIFTILAVSILVWILTYVFIKGFAALSIDFFTQLPTPAGVPGGGLINAMVGSFITVGIGILIAAPIGILVAMFVARHPNSPLGLGIRFSTDVISGVPSIVMGIFAYSIIVLPQRHFSAFSGGLVLMLYHAPDHHPYNRGDAENSPQ